MGPIALPRLRLESPRHKNLIALFAAPKRLGPGAKRLARNKCRLMPVAVVFAFVMVVRCHHKEGDNGFATRIRSPDLLASAKRKPTYASDERKTGRERADN